MGLSSADLDKIKSVIVTVFKEEIMKELEINIDKRLKDKMDEEMIPLKNTQEKLTREISELKIKNRSLEKMVDRQEQASRGLNIRLFGVVQEKEGDLREVILNIFNNKMQCDIRDCDIKTCYRVATKNSGENDIRRVTRSHSQNSNSEGGKGDGRKPPAILVRFANDRSRTAVLKNRKNLKSTGIVIKEDLTRFRLSLLSKAVEEYTGKNAWCLHGNIYIRTGDVVHRIEDFEKLGSIPKAIVNVNRR